MTTVHVICEGLTEMRFVNGSLVGVFAEKGIYLHAPLIGSPGHKGGNFTFDRLAARVEKLLLGNKSAYCTTLFDFYGLPHQFPGKQEALGKNGIQNKAECLYKALNDEMAKVLGTEAAARFFPYVQMHEFEGLLFSDPAALAQGMGKPSLEPHLRAIRDGFDTPENINNSPFEAPSKRILGLHSRYQKVVDGMAAANGIGLAVIRQECRLFDGWLNHIEALA